MAASLDRRADASRRCPPDWPSDGGGPYDVEDSAYKLHFDEISKRDHHHHPNHQHHHHHLSVHPGAGQAIGYGSNAPHVPPTPWPEISWVSRRQPVPYTTSPSIHSRRCPWWTRWWWFRNPPPVTTTQPTTTSSAPTTSPP
ncbi:Hypothetical protein, putative [Bodo saltans]|uniref:Uncharacterized protein n=1 Tax=Bodo saltans TaxID=75058 RepID=A0A0S4IJB9_BODSA|nr:Hypothetical protein, putative [Bodo saltans]|eukprot:CUE79287.1 Hypothetical protein, putative [Bodo saltans]